MIKPNRRSSSRSCSAIPVSVQILRALGGDVPLLCADLLEQGRHKEYLDLGIDPLKYTCKEDFFRDYIAVSILSKFPKLRVDVNREKVAIEKFLKSEERCLEASKSLSDLRRARINPRDPAHAVLHSARQKIAHLLGPFNWDECRQYFNFGPGACVGLPRSKGDAYHKFGQKRPTTTKDNAVLVRAMFCSSPTWFHYVSGSLPEEDPWTEVQGNRITTVPKNAKTDRVIAIEPQLNMFFQKGIGAVLRKRLKRVNVNLDSQSLNQKLAYQGSLDGSLATIDLSAASDCVSLALVEDLLPVEWVSALKQCRSPFGVLPTGEKILYRKFSSMGNGYTFELESLIFWAIGSAVISYLKESDRRFAVYGDDIVIPTGCAELLINVLALVGFDTNKDKTFTHGLFRESCGKHFFSGAEVTPIYIREDVTDVERTIWLCNSIRRLAHRVLGCGWGCDARLLPAYEMAKATLPGKFKVPTIPLFSLERDYSDMGLAGDFDEVTPRRAPRGFEGYVARGLRRKYVSYSVGEVPALLKCLHFLEQRQASLTSSQRYISPGPATISLWDIPGGVSNVEIPSQRYVHRPIKLVVPQWGDAGPWV